MTDSVACVPRPLADALGIAVVPIWIIYNGQSYRDGLDVEPHEVYRRLRNGAVVTTSAPSVGDFITAYQQMAARHPTLQHLVVITLPAELSGVYQHARMAAEASPIPVTVVDSRTAGPAQGWVVVEAARTAQTGGDLQAVLQRIAWVRPRSQLFAMVPELQYLRRGGRIVRAAARLGAALGVVPILAITRDGEIEPMAVARGKETAMERMVAKVREDLAAGGRLHLAVIEADAPEDAERLLQRLEATGAVAERYITPFTPAMGAHTGPGLVGVGYWVDPATGSA